eukprot:1805287-Rhodomonas_salina.1
MHVIAAELPGQRLHLALLRLAAHRLSQYRTSHSTEPELHTLSQYRTADSECQQTQQPQLQYGTGHRVARA